MSEPAELRLVFRTKPKALAELEDELFGKRILFTDRDEWTIAEVVAGYRSQSDVEADFRQMKDPKVVSFSPMFHWTDQKIRVHVAHCVLALMTARLMVREAANAGMGMSVRELLSTLAGIEETVLLYQGERGRPRAREIVKSCGWIGAASFRTSVSVITSSWSWSWVGFWRVGREQVGR